MIRDTAARNASLANDYGASRGPNAPTSLEVALFNGDPGFGGTELDADPITGGGYARVVVPNDDTTWPDAPANGAITSAPIDFGTSTDAWPDTATHWCLFDAADSTTAWDTGVLGEEQAVDEAGTGVVVALTVYYSEGL